MSPETQPEQWPLAGGALVVDDELIFRETICSQLAAIGCTCFQAESYTDALRVLERERDIDFVLLDHPSPSENTRDFVTQFRKLRPEAILVGNSGSDRREDFSAAGVGRYLDKPWGLGDLLVLLRERYGDCVDCGIPLPLRRPRPHETGTSWACASCGSCYWGIRDDETPEDWQRNAVAVDSSSGK